MRFTQLPANVSVLFKDGVGQEVGSDLTEKCSQRGSGLGKVWVAFDVFDDLGIGQDAGCHLVARKPRSDKVNGRLTAVE